MYLGIYVLYLPLLHQVDPSSLLLRSLALDLKSPRALTHFTHLHLIYISILIFLNFITTATSAKAVITIYRWYVTTFNIHKSHPLTLTTIP